MLTFPPLNWAMIFFLIVPIPLTTLVTKWLVKNTNWLRRPDLGIVEDEDCRALPHLPLPPPLHQCVCDFDRSQILVRRDGTVLAMCSVNGCGATMVIGRDIAHLYPVEPAGAFAYGQG